MLDLYQTDRGFFRAEFRDRYDESCSIQESSLATEAALWLGSDKALMHLTQYMVAELVPLLDRFARTGTLDPDQDDDRKARTKPTPSTPKEGST